MKPLASLSMDLDNLWSYMKTHGDAGWEDFPSYFDILIPYVLDVLDRLSLEMTFFIVGQDATLDKNKDVLKLLTARGHEVGNHSFQHEPWLHLYSKNHIEKEVVEAEENIFCVTGQKPIGFRGPGFSWNTDLLKILFENGYMYDATTLPNYIGSLAQTYYFRNFNLSLEEKNKRKAIRLGFKEGMRPVKPYFWNLPMGGKLLEIPVTTTPVIKAPFHMSYLFFLGRFSMSIMLLYLKFALCMCQLTGTEPSFLIHPTDLLGGEQVPAMRFFPGMDLSRERKLQLFDMVIRTLCKHYKLVNMSTHAKSILENNTLKVIQL